MAHSQRCINVGLVGAGLSATTFHAPFLKQSTAFKITGILRVSSPKPVVGLEEVPVYTDVQEFLTSEPTSDLVIITTPTHTHYSLAKLFLSAGRHIILEKPMTSSYAEARELCQLARDKDRLLAVYHNRRWDGDFLTASALIKCGVLGRLVQFESHFDRYRPALKSGWKEDAELPGAGVLYDLGSHLIDQALSLFGPPSRVTGLSINERHLPACAVPDAFTITLHYDRPDGPLTVLLRSSSLCAIPGPRFTLHGTQGSWVKHGMDVQEDQLRAGMKPMQPGFGADQPGGYGVLDSQALELNPALQAAAPAGPLEPLPEVPEGMPTSPAAAAAVVVAEAAESAMDAATAAAVAGRMGASEADTNEPAATVSGIAAAVLAKIDAGGAVGTAGAAGAGSSRVRVVTQQGSWHKFYEEVGGLLLAVNGQPKSALHVTDSNYPFSEASGAIMGSTGVENSGSIISSSGLEINSQLTVTPEAAAAAIRVIKLVLQSNKEGRTLPFDVVL